MTEFYNLPSVAPAKSDELLIVRDRIGRRATVNALQTAIAGGVAFSEQPPADDVPWWQTKNGIPIELWFPRGNGVWVSAQHYAVSWYWHETNSNQLITLPNSCPTDEVWIDSFLARGRLEESFSDSNQRWDFELNLVNSANQEIPFWKLTLDSGSAGQRFTLMESVGEVVSQDDSLSFWLRATRTKSKPKLQLLTLSSSIRRVTRAQTNGSP